MPTPSTYYRQGRQLQQQGQLAEARNAYQKALTEDPQNIELQSRIEMIDSILAFGNTQIYNV